jgi:hypothetical protein
MSTEVSSPAVNPAVEVHSSTDPLHLIDVDYVRLYVGNAKQSAFYYAYAFGSLHSYHVSHQSLSLLIL